MNAIKQTIFTQRCAANPRGLTAKTLGTYIKKNTLQFASLLCCLGFASSAFALDVLGNFGFVPEDTIPAVTNFNMAGQNGTWQGSVNGFIALSDDPGNRDTSDVLSFTISNGLVGNLSFGTISGSASAFTFSDQFTISLNGPVTGTGTALTTFSNLMAGNYTATINNLSRYPNIATYTMTVTVDNPSAVPEPETDAMMLAGLGLMGFAARRKASN